VRRISKKPKSKLSRRFSFTGNSVSDSVLIGNYGDARFMAKGHFNLSGILYCLDGKVDLTAIGTGQISFLGKCKELVIKEADGNCILDFSELKCDLVRCESLKGQVTVLLGDVRRVDILHMNEEATLKISSNPLVTAHLLEQNARIVCPRLSMPPVVVQPSHTMCSIL
jgi:hypothetical protein